MTNAVNLASAAGTGFAFRNRILNPSFELWQRGTSTSISGSNGNAAYGAADRFTASHNSSGTFSFSRDTSVPTGFLYSGKVSSSSITSSQYLRIQQNIESFNSLDLVDQTITVSFWVRSANNEGTVTLFYGYPTITDTFGTMEFPANSQGTTRNVTSTWTRHTQTFSLQASSGGHTAQKGLQIIVSYTPSTNGAREFQIAGLQVEKGSASDFVFERRPYGQEVALCQRYFCKSSSLNVVPVNGAGYTTAGMFFSSVAGSYLTTAAYSPFMKFPVTMRTEPGTITIYNTSLPSPSTAGQWSIFSPSGGVWYNCSVSVQSVTQEGWAAALAGSWGSSGALPLYGAWAASAEL